MKYPLALAAATTALSTQVFATNCGKSCSPPPPCCEPKPCVSCECYVPIYQPLEGCDAFVSVDALYWFARERNLYYAIEGTMLPVGQTTGFSLPGPLVPAFTMLNQECRSLGTHWSPGVRAQVGWSSDCNDWDLGLDWTYFHNQKTNRSSVPAFFIVNVLTETSLLFFPGPEQSAIFNPWVNQAALFSFIPQLQPVGGRPTSLNYLFFPNVKASWRLTLNNIALSLGRTFRLRNGFALRSYAGMRGAWTKTRFQTKSHFQENLFDEPSGVQANIDLLAKDRFIDHFWGVGIQLGIEPSWRFCSNWSIFANFDAALLYGKSKSQKREHYQGTQSQNLPTLSIADYNTVAFKGAFFSMQPIFDLALGLRFEQSWCCNRYHSEIDLAWEHHLWLENNYRMISLGPVTSVAPAPGLRTASTSQLSINGGYEEISTTLEYGGPILRVRFDF